MARKWNRRRAALGGTIAVIVIVTAVVLYLMFRENFAAAIVGVVGVVLGVAALIVGLIPLFSPPAPVIPPQPSPVTDGSRYANLQFPMTPRERPGGKPQAEDKSGE